MKRICPIPDLVVPGPDGRPLPAQGIVVPDAMVSRFWRRREADGDVTITTAAEAAPAKAVQDKAVKTAKTEG